MIDVPGLFSLKGKVAIVTGAGKGIGRACAIAFAQAGADVALAARTRSDLEAVAAEIQKLGQRAISVVCDVNDEAMLDNLVARTQAELGGIHVLVNNAGGTGPNDPGTTSAEDFNHALSWNVTPAFLLIQKVADPMRASGGGSVINISSVAARFAQKNFSAYAAAKAALNHLSRNLANDYAPDIRINVIEPGPILTDSLADYLKTAPEHEKAMLGMIPMGAFGKPEDIAAAALYFASDASRWVTSKVLGVEGGAERVS
ncbi:7-alpha-hydroxysteroid dehydrogenase [Oryzisolibacter propanilivorax]|uniref:7-alpha-hydroxysteroid dehydrogenase n=2 Tax=Oryzisolibacter propanilivorax TaxID=1527607 RepID=A0A1G9RQR4_9BURK|nr:7-alpha-hydroxysteroid dehydrogenase [Oryzisolibacter propanilivorax]